MPELSSLFCVALRASCVRFRLPVSLPGSGPLSPSHKRKAALGWVIDGAARPGSPLQRQTKPPQGILVWDFKEISWQHACVGVSHCRINHHHARTHALAQKFNLKERFSAPLQAWQICYISCFIVIVAWTHDPRLWFDSKYGVKWVNVVSNYWKHIILYEFWTCKKGQSQFEICYYDKAWVWLQGHMGLSV